MVVMLLVTMLPGNMGMAAPAAEKLNYPELTYSFYKKKGNFWTADDRNGAALRKKLISLVNKSSYKGLNKKRYHTSLLQAFHEGEIAPSKQVEYYFADAAITYCKDLVKAPEINSWLSYDDVSQKSGYRTDEKLMRTLLEVDDDNELAEATASFEPRESQYYDLLEGLAQELRAKEKSQTRIKKFKTSLVYYRWIHHFNFDKYIVVNIASAKLRYYENEEQRLIMKIVAGDTPTRTPRFAAYCNQLTLYPYWHVPRSIATKEILPFCKENQEDIAGLDLQVLDASGRIVDPTTVNWKKYSANNLPYNFRHEPGCDNPLGLIKFNLTDPFDIYLHDTNLKPVFKQKKRFYSHGCVRLEKPDELANIFLDEKLSHDFLSDCQPNMKPRVKTFDPVPVFVVYMPAEVTSPGAVTLYNDVYKLL